MGTMMMFRIMGLRMFMALKSNLVMAHPIKRIIILPIEVKNVSSEKLAAQIEYIISTFVKCFCERYY